MKYFLLSWLVGYSLHPYEENKSYSLSKLHISRMTRTFFFHRSFCSLMKPGRKCFVCMLCAYAVLSLDSDPPRWMLALSVGVG